MPRELNALVFAQVKGQNRVARENGVEAGKPISDPKVFGLIAAQIEKIQNLQSKHAPGSRQFWRNTGWPGSTLVGTDGAHAAWLIVQHADADPALQEKCLKLMTAAPAGDPTRRGQSAARRTSADRKTFSRLPD
jgi:hypothetical protein